jgi:hypothetical protein
MVSIFAIGFYFYRESFDASAFSTAVSSLLSAILVILLVWERLRDSLYKKLEYLHKNFLFKLYSNRSSLFWTQDEIRRLRSDLDRYGKFLILRLYPSSLLKEIDEFLSLHGEFFKRYQEIEGLAMKQMGIENRVNLTRELLQYYIGLTPDWRPSSYASEAEKKYKETAEMIIKENSQLVSKTKDFLEKTRKSQKLIHNELEDFLKSNNLRLEPEPSV